MFTKFSKETQSEKLSNARWKKEKTHHTSSKIH